VHVAGKDGSATVRESPVATGGAWPSTVPEEEPRARARRTAVLNIKRRFAASGINKISPDVLQARMVIARKRANAKVLVHKSKSGVRCKRYPSYRRGVKRIGNVAREI